MMVAVQNKEKLISLSIFIVTSIVFFLLRGDYLQEDGMIFWKYILFADKGIPVLPFYAIFFGHPLWHLIYLFLSKTMPLICRDIDVKTVGNVMSAFFSGAGAYYFYKLLRVLKEKISDALLCTLFCVLSFGYMSFATTVNTAALSIFAINFFLFYYFSYAEKGFPLISACMLGALFVVACLFYLSPVALLPAVVVGVFLRVKNYRRSIIYIFVFAAVGVATALIMYRFIYFYMNNSNFSLFDVLEFFWDFARYRPAGYSVTFLERVGYIVSNIGGIYFGGGYIGLYGGICIIALVYYYCRAVFLKRISQDARARMMILITLCGLAVATSGNYCMFPKALIGVLGPLTYILYKALKELLGASQKQAYKVLSIGMLLAGLVGVNGYYYTHPYSPNNIFFPMAPHGAATKGFYEFVKWETPPDAFIFYDASYTGRNFGNTIIFFSDRMSLTDSEHALTFLGGATKTLKRFFALNQGRYGSYWLVSTRSAYTHIYIPIDMTFEEYADFEKIGQYGRISLLKLVGTKRAQDILGEKYRTEDILNAQRIIGGDSGMKLKWAPMRVKGENVLMMRPFPVGEDDISNKVLFYW